MSHTASTPSADEGARIAAVQRYDVLDTPPDGAFDRVTRLASCILDMPIAIVSIVDTDRIWFKSAHGLEGVEEVDRQPGLCASAILANEPWIVEDASLDARSLSNPLVAGEFGLRFYAGVPLTTHDGYNLGTICVIDREARELPPGGLQVLEDLAAIVMDELELRRVALGVRGREARRARHATELNDDVVQRLFVARLAIEMGRDREALGAVDAAIAASQRVLDDLTAEASTFERRAATSLD